MRYKFKNMGEDDYLVTLDNGMAFVRVQGDEEKVQHITSALSQYAESISANDAPKKTKDVDGYTPEPWFLKHDGWTIRAVAEPQERICHTYTPADDAATVARQVANANRIVECVNACAGIPDPVSEIAQLRAAITKATGH